MDFINEQKPDYSRHEGESLIAVAKISSSIKTIFLSSTFEDLREYIEKVQISVQQAGVFCSNQSWVTPYVPTIDECRQRLDASDAYVGIFAYWYGSIPPNYQQSITHLEFNWAKEKWNGSNPPIAILMPEELSEAGKFLKERALQIICSRAVKQDEHEHCLKTFHREVDNKNQWRMITRFRDLTDLCVRVAIVCKQWAGLSPLAAAQKKIDLSEKYEIERKVTDEELGSLGREKQLGDLKRVISNVYAFPDVPAIAFVVTGNKDAGQYEFLQHIARRKKIKGRPPKIGRPQVEQYGLSLLIQWAGESLGVLLSGQEANSLPELAAVIYSELQNQQLCLILDEIHRYAGGVSAFYQTFWLPLYEELEKLHKQKPVSNKLIVVIVDYTGKSEEWNTITKEFSAGQITRAHYSKLFLLKLTPITGDDLWDWFDEVEVSAEKRKYLASIALRDINNQDDGTPQEVFRKLRKENLWDE